MMHFKFTTLEGNKVSSRSYRVYRHRCNPIKAHFLMLFHQNEKCRYDVSIHEGIQLIHFALSYCTFWICI